MAIQWSLVIFTTLTGAAGWMLASLAYAEVKGIQRNAAFPATLIAIVLLIVGGCASVTHLAHPERMLAALGHPTSGIFTEAALVGVTALFAIIYLIMLKREGGASARKGLIIIAAVFGVLLSFMAGASYMMAARVSWNTALLPLGYLGTAIPAGIACYLACVCAKGDASALGAFPKLLLVGGIVAAALAGIYMATVASADATLFGWVLAVVACGVLPAIMGYLMDKKPESALALASAAAVCAIVGCIAYRAFMWVSMSTLYNFFSPM